MKHLGCGLDGWNVHFRWEMAPPWMKNATRGDGVRSSAVRVPQKWKRETTNTDTHTHTLFSPFFHATRIISICKVNKPAGAWVQKNRNSRHINPHSSQQCTGWRPESATSMFLSSCTSTWTPVYMCVYVCDWYTQKIRRERRKGKIIKRWRTSCRESAVKGRNWKSLRGLLSKDSCRENKHGHAGFRPWMLYSHYSSLKYFPSLLMFYLFIYHLVSFYFLWLGIKSEGIKTETNIAVDCWGCADDIDDHWELAVPICGYLIRSWRTS